MRQDQPLTADKSIVENLHSKTNNVQSNILTVLGLTLLNLNKIENKAAIGKRKQRTKIRRWNVHRCELIREISEGQWDNYLEHNTALLLHGVKSDKTEPEKRMTKNSLKNYQKNY